MTRALVKAALGLACAAWLSGCGMYDDVGRGMAKDPGLGLPPSQLQTPSGAAMGNGAPGINRSGTGQ